MGVFSLVASWKYLVPVIVPIGGVVTLALWPVERVIVSDPELRLEATSQTLSHYGAHVVRRSPAEIAVVELPRYQLWLMSRNKKQIVTSRVLPPLEIAFDEVAPTVELSAAREGKLLVLRDHEVLDRLAEDDSARLGAATLSLPGRDPVSLFRSGPRTRLEFPGGGTLNWAGKTKDGTGDLQVSLTDASSRTLDLSLLAPTGAVSVRFNDARPGNYVMKTSSADRSGEPVLDARTGPIADTVCSGDKYKDEDVPVVTLIPVVTTDAVKEYGVGVYGTVNAAITQLNEILQWSGVRAKVVLTPAVSIDPAKFAMPEDQLVESLRRDAESLDIFGTSDSPLDTLQTNPVYKSLRWEWQQANADLAILVTAGMLRGGAPGWAAATPANGALFYGVVNGGAQVLEQLTIAHEIGHLFGLRHALDEEGETSPPFGHGFKFRLESNPKQQFGTVMARGELSRVKRFSNTSERPCQGVFLGVPHVADEAATISANVEMLTSLSEERGRFVRSNASATVCNSLHVPSVSEVPGECSSRAQLVLHFPHEGADLTPNDKLRLAQFIRSAPRTLTEAYAGQMAGITKGTQSFIGVPVIVIAGHTDSVGSPEYNYALSLLRANAAYESVGKTNLPIYVCAYGLSRLACPDANDKDAQAYNRRIEVDVVLAPPTKLVVAARSAASVFNADLAASGEATRRSDATESEEPHFPFQGDDVVERVIE